MDATDDFLRAHLEAQPEDASTLGYREHAARLLDPSADPSKAARDRLLATPPLEGDLDDDAARRIARFFRRYHAQDWHAANLELASLPNAALQHAALHARSAEDFAAIAARARATPGFLAAHAENLRRGARRVDRDVATTFAERILPGAARGVGTLAADASARGATAGEASAIEEGARRAAEAYADLARVVAEEILPVATPTARLGEEEVRFRLAEVMGVEESVEDLLAMARAELRPIEDPMSLLAPKPKDIGEALAGYRRDVASAIRFVRERRLLHVPEDLALVFTRLPDGIADGAGLTNWPAPLTDPRGEGHALYADDPGAHPIVSTRQLAVHECIPGHYLQSVVWQRAFTTGALPARAAIRFLGTFDDVAGSHGFFATMMSIEGWAVAMERLLFAEGFLDPGAQTAFFGWCEAVRATRVLLDLELHAGQLDEDALAAMVARGTRMPEAWARAQVLRAKRLPLQGLTYLVGALAIEALRRERGGEAIDFYGALLALGPVPPSRARAALGGPLRAPET